MGRPVLLADRYPQLAQLERKNHWVFRERSPTGTIHQPEWKEGMWFFPLETTQVGSLHPEAIRRIQAVAKQQKISQIVIGHEVPKLIPPPAGWKPPEKKPLITPEMTNAGFQVLALAVGVVGMLILEFALVGLGTIDPVVVVVLEDGTWLDVFSYLEPFDPSQLSSGSERPGLLVQVVKSSDSF